MKPASFPVGDHRKRIMYISLRFKGPASDWFTAMKEMQWISYDHWVGEFKRNVDNPHARDDAIRNMEKAVQRSGQKTADFVAYMRKQQLEGKLAPDNLWSSLWTAIPTAIREYLARTRAYQSMEAWTYKIAKSRKMSERQTPKHPLNAVAASN